MVDRDLLKQVMKILYKEHLKTKGGAIKPETDLDIKQVTMVKPPSVGGSTKKSNPWMDHVKKVKSENPSMKYSDVLKKAKSSYTKKGGEIVTQTYPSQKTTKTSHDYETTVENPVKAQDKLWGEYKQNKGKKTKSVTVDQKSSKGTKPKVTFIKPEKNTKTLKMRKPKKEPDGVQPVVKLQINKMKPSKTLSKQIGEEIKKLTGVKSADEILRDARTFVPKREGQDVNPVSYGELPPLFGRGMITFEKQMFKHIEKETKDMSPTKAKTFARKYITESLKQKGWKPIEIKPILQMALERLNKLGGAVLPKTNVEVLLEGLEKSGVFDATSKSLASMATKLTDVVNDPHKYRFQSILTRDIPNLQLKYDKLKNIWDIKSSTWTQFRQNNHKIRMMNVKSDIANRLNKLAGIQIIQPSTEI